MTKSITFATIAIAGTLFFAFAFKSKSSDGDKKEYVAIYQNTYEKELSLSYSNGTFKTVEFQKRQGVSDQTQMLKIINEQENLGYKLINYDYKIGLANSNSYVTTVLLSK